MATRPIFVPNFGSGSPVTEIPLTFQYFAGFSAQQKQKSIASLHDSARQLGIYPILEISTKSTVELGIQLSAFNLQIKTRDGNKVPVEAAYQGGKIFEHGGPFRDLYNLLGRQIKSDKRLKESGDLVAFDFDGDKWALEPKTAFYDWLYVTALIQNPELNGQLSNYKGFSDIEFNPRKSINCQARAAALFVALEKRNWLLPAMSNQESFNHVLKNGTPPVSLT